MLNAYCIFIIIIETKGTCLRNAYPGKMGVGLKKIKCIAILFCSDFFVKFSLGLHISKFVLFVAVFLEHIFWVYKTTLTWSLYGQICFVCSSVFGTYLLCIKNNRKK